MPVYFDKAVFVHIPKTGGTTVSKYLFDQFGKKIMRVNGKKVGHIPVGFIEKDLFRFAFIRDPHKWWESVYKMLLSTKRDMFYYAGFQPLSIVHPLICNDFNKFIERIIEHLPGFYCQLLKMYIGHQYDGLEFVGRTERLEDDLCKVLDKLKVKYDKDKLYAMPKHGNRKMGIEWKPKLKEKIKSLEKDYYSIKTS